MERVVLGVDRGSGRKALEWVIRRSMSRPTRVHLIRAFDLVDSDPEAEARLLEDTAAQLRERSPQTEIEQALVWKQADAALLQAAEAADLLVVGSRHGHPILSTLTGSLPLRVAAGSTCATVIVPDDWTPPMRRTVVVGISSDNTSDRAMLFAAHEAQSCGADLEAVHAWTVTVPSMTGRIRAVQEADARAQHRQILSDALERIRAAYPRVRIRGLLEQRLPSTVLAEHASRGQLLVLGSPRWGPLAGMVLGSTARAVLPAATAPLCIVPPTVAIPTDPVLAEHDAISPECGSGARG
jgi:nucleotide-binding universal stress UspA family protein